MVVQDPGRVRVDRVTGHKSMDGGRLAGMNYDLTQIYIRVSSSCWMMVASSATQGDGINLPISVRG